MSNTTAEYFLHFNRGVRVRLKKGMTREEVISILGEPSSTISCLNPLNEKLVFRKGKTSFIERNYLLFFIRKELEYAVKIA